MEAFTTSGEELAYWRVRTGGLDELDPGLADAEHRGDDALLLDCLRLSWKSAKVLFVEEGRGLYVLDRVAQVVDPVEHTSIVDQSGKHRLSARITGGKQ
jgi:hypothetical protein